MIFEEIIQENIKLKLDVKMSLLFGIMMKMEKNTDIMLIFLYHLKIVVLKLSLLGPYRKKKILYF